MKKIFLIFCCLSVLLLSACSDSDSGEKKEYEHTPYVSTISKEDCFICGEHLCDTHFSPLFLAYSGENNVGIVNLNTFDIMRIEINRYDEQGNLVEKKAGYADLVYQYLYDPESAVEELTALDSALPEEELYYVRRYVMLYNEML